MKIDVLNIREDGYIALCEIDNQHAFNDIKELCEAEYLEYHWVKIGKTIFGVYMDDCGMLNGKPISAFSRRYGYLRGSLCVCHVQDVDDEDYRSLTEDDISELYHNLAIGRLAENEDTLVVLNDQRYI